MNKYVTDSTGVGISLNQIRRSHPNTSFPRRPSDEFLETLGYARLKATPQPPYDPDTQRVVRAPNVKVDGEWTQQWQVEDLSPEEIDARYQQQQEERRAGVLEERARRIAAGFDHDFGDDRGVHRIGTTPNDMLGWDEVQRWADSQFALGKLDEQLLIKTGTGPVLIKPLEWYALIEAAGEFRQPIWQASFVLQEMDPIPEDYYDDKWWP